MTNDEIRKNDEARMTNTEVLRVWLGHSLVIRHSSFVICPQARHQIERLSMIGTRTPKAFGGKGPWNERSVGAWKRGRMEWWKASLIRHYSIVPLFHIGSESFEMQFLALAVDFDEHRILSYLDATNPQFA